MNNKKKYKKSFLDGLSIDENDLVGNLEYNAVLEWDSIGHMSLIAELEDQFDIMMEMDDIIDFSSYNRGMEILTEKYGISF